MLPVVYSEWVHMVRRGLAKVAGVTGFASALLLAATVSADPISFSFTGSQGGATGEGSLGNTRTFTAGGVTLTASAWGYTKGDPDNAFETAALGRWSSGLGACNRTEFPCGSPSHQVDNVGSDDWVLFVFSTAVDITSVRIDPYGNYDRDVSYYVGNVASNINLSNVSYAGLAGLGFAPRQSSSADPSSDYRDVNIPGTPQYVNAILIGGYIGGDEDDYFKISGLAANTRTAVPEPSTMLLMLSGAAALLPRSRRLLRRCGEANA